MGICSSIFRDDGAEGSLVHGVNDDQGLYSITMVEQYFINGA